MLKLSGIDIIIIAFGLAALAVFLGFVIIAEKRLREQRKDVVEKNERKFKQMIDD